MSEQKIHSWFTRDPSESEIRGAAQTLRQLEPGFLPLNVFLEFTRLAITCTVELAPVREKDDGLEVLLTSRPDHDTYWPGQWHIPGVVLLASDKEASFESAVERVMQRELHGVVPMTTEPRLARQVFHTIARGRELDHVFYFETDVKDEELVEGQFFNVNALPDNVIDFHVPMIESIVASHQKGASPDLLQAPWYNAGNERTD